MDRLFEYAESNNYHIYNNLTISTKSLSIEINNNLFINIDESKFETDSEKKVCLAHELGHCISGTLYTLNHSNLYRGSAEYRADYRAAQLIMPIYDLKDCICRGITEKYELAEYFNVTEEFIDRTLYIYSNKGLLDNMVITL